MKKSTLLSGAIILVIVIFITGCNNGTSTSTNQTNDTTTPASADSTSITEVPVDYSHNGQVFKSFAAYNNKATAKLPVVLVVPEWWGITDYIKGRLKQLAELGYFAMAVDMYGNGKVTDNPDSAGIWVPAYYKDPALAQNNFDAAVQEAKSFAQADTSKIAAIGYCFGGGIVLNMARLGEKLKGVASFHGQLNGYLPPAKKNSIIPALLVCQGEADSMVKPEEVTAFKKEMNNAGANYKFISYPGAKHAFTNPGATAIGEKYKLDIAYNEAADKGSWRELEIFLQSVFK